MAKLEPCWPLFLSKWGEAISHHPLSVFQEGLGSIINVSQKGLGSILEGLGLDFRSIPRRFGLDFNGFSKRVWSTMLTLCSSMLGMLLDGLVGSRGALRIAETDVLLCHHLQRIRATKTV